MDYTDQVFVEISNRVPGRYSVARLKKPEKFIEAVKILIDGEWLTNVEFSGDYKYLVVFDHSGFKGFSDIR